MVSDVVLWGGKRKWSALEKTKVGPSVVECGGVWWSVVECGSGMRLKVNRYEGR